MERLKTIYRQEILQTEPINPKGRKAKEIVVSKVKDIKTAEKEAEKTERKNIEREIVIDLYLRLV